MSEDDDITVKGFIKYLKFISGIVAAVMVLIGAWWQITDRIETSLTEAITQQTVMIHERNMDDLRKRIMVQESKITWYQSQGEVPEWIIFENKLTEDSLMKATEWKPK